MVAARLALTIEADVAGPLVPSERGFAYAAVSGIERDGLSSFFQRWMSASFVPDPVVAATSTPFARVATLVSGAGFRCTKLFCALE
jgi:hypothetical protein